MTVLDERKNMAKARKPWLFKKPGRTGQWVGWTDKAGKRHNKKFPNKSLAEMFMSRLTVELNDAYHAPGDPKTATWPEIIEAHIQNLRFKQDAENTIKKRRLVLGTLTKVMTITDPRQLTQDLIEKYFVALSTRLTRFGTPTKPATIHGEIGHLRAFLLWATDETNRYLAGPFRLPKYKKIQWRKPRALVATQVKRLLALFDDTKIVEHPLAWKVRLLLAFHGIRRSDIEKMKPADFDAETMRVRAREKKTKKWAWRDINKDAWSVIWPYVASLSPHAQRIFPDTVTSKKWKRICAAAGLVYKEFRFHDTRVTFASAMAEKKVPTGVTQKLLNHSTAELTNSVYTDFDPTLRPAVEELPVAAWLGQKGSKKTEPADPKPADSPPAE
jgi:integrase